MGPNVRAHDLKNLGSVSIYTRGPMDPVGYNKSTRHPGCHLGGVLAGDLGWALECIFRHLGFREWDESMGQPVKLVGMKRTSNGYFRGVIEGMKSYIPSYVW